MTGLKSFNANELTFNSDLATHLRQMADEIDAGKIKALSVKIENDVKTHLYPRGSILQRYSGYRMMKIEFFSPSLAES